MKSMGLKIRHLSIGFLLFFAGLTLVQAQQMPISMSQIFRPRLLNPARSGSVVHHNVFLSHQQRKILVPGWRSISQFLNYNSQPMGRSANWGWGINVVNDIEHTESRFNFTGSIAVQAIKTASSSLSLGINLGVVSWNSNYKETFVHDRDDPLLSTPFNFVDLDAGAGIGYSFSSKKVKFDLDGLFMQLPGNFLSAQLQGIRIIPHGVAAGKLLLSPLHNVHIGPMFFYRNIVFDSSTALFSATTDIGLMLELARQNIWVGGAYRVNRGALTGAFGMQVLTTDTAAMGERSGLFVDLNAGFSLPMWEGGPFGPSVEIGLDVSFGRPFANRDYSDTLRIIDGAFWKNDGNLNRHTDNFLVNSPMGLKSGTYVTSRNVLLTYYFPDQSLQYVGTTPIIEDDSLKAVGVEWVGVDGLIEGIVDYVIGDALYPDSTSISNIDSLEVLKSMVSIELRASLQASERDVNQLAEGTVYEGELGTNNATDDTLFLDIIYNEIDTVLGIALYHYLNNLELAALKLHAIRMKMEYELKVKYGEVFYFKRLEDPFDPQALVGRKQVIINRMRITPNNPNQDAFQVNKINLKFSRNPRKSDGQDGDILPDDLPSKEKRKKRNRRTTGRRDRR